MFLTFASLIELASCLRISTGAKYQHCSCLVIQSAIYVYRCKEVQRRVFIYKYIPLFAPLFCTTYTPTANYQFSTLFCTFALLPIFEVIIAITVLSKIATFNAFCNSLNSTSFFDVCHCHHLFCEFCVTQNHTAFKNSLKVLY